MSLTMPLLSFFDAEGLRNWLILYWHLPLTYINVYRSPFGLPLQRDRKSSLAKWNSSQAFIARNISCFQIRSNTWHDQLVGSKGCYHNTTSPDSIHSPTQAVQWANLQVTRLPLSVASFARRTCQAHSTHSQQQYTSRNRSDVDSSDCSSKQNIQCLRILEWWPRTNSFHCPSCAMFRATGTSQQEYSPHPLNSCFQPPHGSDLVFPLDKRCVAIFIFDD